MTHSSPTANISTTYVISDLHLGGVYSKRPKGRGFRINTNAAAATAFVQGLTEQSRTSGRVELVINGDLIDFLAEKGSGLKPWVPFRDDIQDAVTTFRAIVRRDSEFFEALRDFLAARNRLVILLGNHDIELALPPVRRELETTLKSVGHDFNFIFDGEAYRIGDCLIEHGNRYDPFNVVDNDALRRVRSLLSRGQEVPKGHQFQPPAGSHVVAEVMNPIKEAYSFIDLLKPESDAAIPLLLTLDPGCRGHLAKFCRAAFKSLGRGASSDALPRFGGDISSTRETSSIEDSFGGDLGSSASHPVARPGGIAPESDEGALREVLESVIPGEAAAFLESVDDGAEDEIGSDISAGPIFSRAVSVAKLLTASSMGTVNSRLGTLLQSIRALQNDQSFHFGVETDVRYLKAAQALADRGAKYVIFGHTHKAKQVELVGGAVYLNTGTWADLMRFPDSIITGEEDVALEELRTFAENMQEGDLSRWTEFRPTYVRIDRAEDGSVTDVALCEHVATEESQQTL